MKKPNIFLSLGMLSLSLSIIIERFGGEMLNTNFNVGFLTGLSVAFNAAFIVLWRKERQME